MTSRICRLVLSVNEESWVLAVNRRHRLRVLWCKVLRKIFRPKRNKVAERLRKLHDEELHKIYSSWDNISVVEAITWASQQTQTQQWVLQQKNSVFCAVHAEML
jgi:Leu/Phe-tRNA-protein transferase